jgi:aryl-alcohol dehydrogenase-like predicted oxidoreductase
MQIRSIGDVKVGAIGLGGMAMSVEDRPFRARSITTIHAALAAGVTLIDTADAYHRDADEVGHNETLIGRAVANYCGDTSDVLIATKGGLLRPGDGSWTHDGSPEHLTTACDASLERLGVEAIGLYHLHGRDPRVPWADSVGALRDLLDAGKIRLAGVSNVEVARIREANEILGGRLASVQNRYSPDHRATEPELDLCADLGIAFLPWSPLGGIDNARSLGARFLAFADVAHQYQVSPQQVCLAWMLAKAPVAIPIPGSSRPQTIRDAAAAADLELSAADLLRLDAAVVGRACQDAEVPIPRPTA